MKFKKKLSNESFNKLRFYSFDLLGWEPDFI